MSHYLHQHKNNHHEAFLTNGMSIALGVNANLEQLDMPKDKHFAGWYIRLIILSIQTSLYFSYACYYLKIR